MLAGFDHLAAAALFLFECSRLVYLGERAERALERFHRLLAHAFDERMQRNAGVAQEVAQAAGFDGSDRLADLFEPCGINGERPVFVEPLAEALGGVRSLSHGGRMPQRVRVPPGFP